jgi:hypothetical protein
MNKMIVAGNNRLMFFDLSRRTDFSRVRILASRPTTSNPGGSMIFCQDLLPYPKEIVSRRQQLDFHPIPKHIENRFCWQSPHIVYVGGGFSGIYWCMPIGTNMLHQSYISLLYHF